MNRIYIALAFSAALSAADIQVISPPNATVVGPYSPGLATGDFLYVSGQGSRNSQGKFAATAEEQVADTIANVRSIVEAAGLTMDHVVYTQVYVSNPAAYEAVETVWKKTFPKVSPARSLLGVHRMPTETPIEISAVAVKNLRLKKVVETPGSNVPVAVIAGDRVWVSGAFGRDAHTGSVPEDPAAQAELALDQFERALKAAGIDLKHVVFTNPYLTEKMPMDVMNRAYARRFEHGNTPARATIRVASLPGGANFELTGVAVVDLSKRRAVRPKNMPPSATASPCVFAGDTLYCSAKAGFIPGPHSGIYASTVEHQVRQTMRNLLDGLEEAGLDFTRVVATNVYVDNLDEFARMNAVYGQYFTSVKPTRTTVQPIASVERKADEQGRQVKLEEVSLVAVK